MWGEQGKNGNLLIGRRWGFGRRKCGKEIAICLKEVRLRYKAFWRK